jgi:hypothetical protein
LYETNVTQQQLALLNGIAAFRTGLLLFRTSIGGKIFKLIGDRNSRLVEGWKQ